MLRMLIQSVAPAVIVVAGISHTAWGVDPARTGTTPIVPGTTTAFVVPTSTSTPGSTSTAPIPGARDRLQVAPGLPGGISPRLAPSPNMPSRGPRWRLGVYSQDTDTGVRILRTVAGSPADRAGLEPEDYIVAVEGYQVGIVNGQQFDCGNEFDLRADSQGRCMLLVHDHRNRQLVNLPIQLESRLAKITGTIAYRTNIYLPPNAVATVELREAYTGGSQGIKLGQQEIRDFRQIPIPFEVEYDPGDVNPRKNYIVTATITANGRPLYTTHSSIRCSRTAGRRRRPLRSSAHWLIRTPPPTISGRRSSSRSSITSALISAGIRWRPRCRSGPRKSPNAVGRCLMSKPTWRPTRRSGTVASMTKPATSNCSMKRCSASSQRRRNLTTGCTSTRNQAASAVPLAEELLTAAGVPR